MKLNAIAFLCIHLLAVSKAHFVLQSPTSFGFNDALEGTGPCDSFDLKTHTSVTNWPIGGYPVQILTTHPQVLLEFRVALANNTDGWVNFIEPVKQTGVGTFCLPSVPGYKAWIGQDAVFEMVQFAPDGLNYQCAAIVFVAGDAAAVPSSCINSTGVGATDAGVTSAVPFGILLPSTMANSATSGITSMTGNMTATSSPTPTQSTAATTSKAASGATSRFEGWGKSGFVGLVMASLCMWMS
ncbi:hypothetical protein G7Y89_g12052 [Cudoniella acicularis]|uniref:Copper acquisition factor BIM1-like domain-containing protein n=1 Tax=Cudoniella acicularis TaxID=354080 RepID=A0A8H4RCA7_9HELO|nr:hypothetical protein G7Y89_g12052 [Cudoniella acicularis]